MEVSSGSVVDLIGDTAAIGERDALTIRNNFEREAVGFETQAGQFGAEASLKRATKSNIDSQIPFALGGTLLTGGAKVAKRWYT